jgi:uracil-DNA glycosylase family 4
MSLDLDQRQRAMLREMGIRLWQPLPDVAEVAGVVAAAAATSISPTAPVPSQPKPAAPSSAATLTPSRRPPVELPVAAAQESPVQATEVTSSSDWALGEARALYPQPAKPAADNGQRAAPGAAARWLVFIETPPEAVEADPLAGETGKLLDNMLRAAGLHHSASAVCVPLSRRLDAGHCAPMGSALAELLRAEKPDVILIMGRLPAQALLKSAEPLGKLRGRVHQLAGVAAVVTYDAAYLLRSLPDKAKAWDDLCRAQHIAQQSPPC